VKDKNLHIIVKKPWRCFIDDYSLEVLPDFWHDLRLGFLAMIEYSPCRITTEYK
jgi:hypothetical protein